jgi:hypothetical protein
MIGHDTMTINDTAMTDRPCREESRGSHHRRGIGTLGKSTGLKYFIQNLFVPSEIRDDQKVLVVRLSIALFLKDRTSLNSL